MSYHFRKPVSHTQTTVFVGAIIIIGLLFVYPLFQDRAIRIAGLPGFWKGTNTTTHDAVLYTLPASSESGTIVIYTLEPAIVGSLVFTPQHEFVGRIERLVSDRIAVVDLFSAAEKEHSVALSIDGVRTVVPARGRNNGTLVVLIPSNTTVETGAAVTTTNGVLLGHVQAVVSSRQDPEQRVFVGLSQSLTTMTGFDIQ